MRNKTVFIPLMIFNNLKSVFLSKENKVLGIITLPLSFVIIPIFLLGAIIIGALALVFQFVIDIFF